MASPQRSAPPPLEGNDRQITAVITAGWAVALVVVLIVQHSLPSGRDWVWTCVAGVVMGCFGLWYVPYLQRSRARTAQRRATERAAARASGTVAQNFQGSPVMDSKTVSSSETPGSSTRS